MHAASGPVVRPALDWGEWQLVAALREIPRGALRDRLSDVIWGLVDFVREPGCPEMQADGVPCADAQAACDRCQKVTSLLDQFRKRLDLA